MSLSPNLPASLDVFYQFFVLFPYNALTIPRQRSLESQARDLGGQMYSMISDSLYRLCTSTESVSALLAREPSLPPGEAWKRLYGDRFEGHRHVHETKKTVAAVEGELERAEQCGNWGPTKPSPLFLKIYHDALCTLEEDPRRGMLSPSLMGSCGVVPLTIISVIPDIARHMSNAIVRAEKEVILATNYWQNGEAAKLIANAMRELSRRAGERGSRIVMKVIYDRGSVRQLFEPHQIVPESTYAGESVGLPPGREIPNIDLQVLNYHHPMLGTFHSKFMIVDRKMAVLQSNNIQDNDNLEMMVRLEGPIVDSVYDMALLCWHKKLDPPLPSHDSPAAAGGLGSPWGDGVGVIPPTDVTAKEPEDFIQKFPSQNTPTGVNGGVRVEEDYGTAKGQGGPSSAGGGEGETISNPRGEEGAPQIPKPNGELPELTITSPHYDGDIAGEVARVQASVSPKPGLSRMDAVSAHLNHTTNIGFVGDAPECPPGREMTPYVLHQPHTPVPMALVCRYPYGRPNHKSVSVPQNAAWLSALRNASKTVFIQSPTLNAEPLVPAIIEACERGVDVHCYICLGYNDDGELLPLQGGHNEAVAHLLYSSLSESGRQRLHYYWYVAKDQTRPIAQILRRRSCHIKLMIVDDHIGIMGSGNQDTQSWFHSQEVNVMIDSTEICETWLDGLRRNQNTALYGMLGREDGIWRSPDGKIAENTIGVDPGRFSWLRGLVGAVRRVKGTGGF